MGELVGEGPTADLGAVEFEGVQAEGLRSGTQRMFPECVEHMADEGGGVTMDELLMLSKGESSRRFC